MDLAEGTELIVVCRCLWPVWFRLPGRPHWTVRAHAWCGGCGRRVEYVFPPAGWTRWHLLEVD